MKKIVLLLLLFICSFFYSCTTKSFNTKNDLWDYLKEEDNGYIQTKNVNGFEYSLLIKPTDLLVSQEISDSYSQKEISDLRAKYKKHIYFTLSISKNQQELLSATPKNRQEFGALVHQLAFGMREKVHVFSQQKDTLEMLDYVYPRMYGMSKATTMLFVYPRNNTFLKGKYLNFSVEDLGNYTGEVKFKVPINSIIREPELKFRNTKKS